MLKRSLVATTIISALLCVISGTFAQSGPQDTTQPASSHKRKPVEWTNDNITSVRSPADDYTIQEQQAHAQATAAKQAADAQKTPSTGEQADALPPDLRPKTTEEADTMIAREEADLASERQYVAQTKKDLTTAPESQKARLQWRVESRSQIIDKIQHNIAELQKQKLAFAKGGEESAAATPSQ